MKSAKVMETRTKRSIHDDFNAREIIIFSKALDEFCKNGYEGASISAIASAVGISEALIYKHVSGKKELFYRAIALGLETEVAWAAHEVVLEGDDVVNRLRRFIRSQIAAWNRNPRLHLLFFHETRMPTSQYSEILNAQSRQFFALLGGILKTGMESGLFRDDLDIVIGRDIVIGGIDQASWWRAERGLPIDVEQMSDQICKMVLLAFQKA